MRAARTFRVGLVGALMATLSLLPAPVNAHDAPNYCGSKRGSGAGWFRAYGHGVGCERTRRIARKWERKCMNQPCRENRPTAINEWPGFECRYRQSGYETVRVRCTARGDRIVHFYWGS